MICHHVINKNRVPHLEKNKMLLISLELHRYLWDLSPLSGFQFVVVDRVCLGCFGEFVGGIPEFKKQSMALDTLRDMAPAP